VARDSVEVLGIRALAWTMDETYDYIVERVRDGEFTSNTQVNVSKLVDARADPELRAAIESCTMVSIDGAGLVWGARLLGCPVPERVAGIDLFARLVAFAADEGVPVYFLGAREEVVCRTASNFQARHPALKVAGFHDGYFRGREGEIVTRIRESGARMVFVGMTSPLQEFFMTTWGPQLGISYVMGVGGSFDVISGMKKRAPLFVQKVGLEWLFRLVQEPGRLGRRYLVSNTVFAALLVREWFRIRLAR
jgi:N-acetylglucosaminyldiphosphoundecaprenol N-acetyl-beta-D-mannosaminyltransferase